jgi:alcohol dehydrogenase class IV
MRFEFATTKKIIFGRNCLSEVAPIASGWGRRALVITGRNDERAEGLKDDLKRQGMVISVCSVFGEPTLSSVVQALQVARADHCEIIIGIGGGSVIDAGKAVAALLTNEGDLFDYLEIIGRSQNLKNSPLPYIAIPTTAGTGTEVTANAVLKFPEHGRKVSLRGPFLLPALAVVDPMLSQSMSPALTAATGMDALTQLLESFVSRKANPVTDALCREGLLRVGRSLRRVFLDGNDLDAREEMSLAALLSGMALAGAGLGAVHGLAAIIGGMYEVPHGVVCARLLSPVMEANYRTLLQEENASSLMDKWKEWSCILTGNAVAGVPDGLPWLRDLRSSFKFPALQDFGLQEGDFQAIAGKARKSSSIRSNPVRLSQEDLARILEREGRSE